MDRKDSYQPQDGGFFWAVSYGDNRDGMEGY